MLLTLSPDPQPVTALAAKAALSESRALEELRSLQQQHLAIAEDDGYELTGPLSWFGGFASAVAYYAARNFVVTVAGESFSHTYLCDVRVKDGRPVGDPLTQTASVFACGTTSRVAIGPAQVTIPTCEDCRSAVGR